MGIRNTHQPEHPGTHIVNKLSAVVTNAALLWPQINRSMTMRLKQFFSALVLMAGLAVPAIAKDANDKLLTYLADRAAIQDLMVTYATAHNTTDTSVYPQVFTDDIKIFTPDGKVILDGLEAVIANARKDRARFNQDAKDGVRTYGSMRHMITNQDTHVTGNTATSDCYLLIVANNAPAKRPEIVAMGRYGNEYVKKNGAWRISKMVSYSDWLNHDMAKILQIGPYTVKENQHDNATPGTYKDQ